MKLIIRTRTILITAAWLALAGLAHAQDAPPATLTLARALQVATDRYPAIEAAAQEAAAAAAGASVARAAYLPRLDAIWQTNRATANNVFGQVLPQSVIPSLTGPVLPDASAATVWSSITGGLLSWEPVDFGRRNAGVREAEAEVAGARARSSLTRLTVERSVGLAFLAAIDAQQAVVATDADVQRRDLLARSARTLADNQLRAGAEASRAEADLAAARTRSIRARQSLLIAQAELGRLLGFPEASIETDAAALMTLPDGAGSTRGSAPHPMLDVATAAVDMAKARADVLATAARPRVYLESSLFARGSGANANGTFEGGIDGLGLERANWAAGVQVVFPNLFEFGAIHARQAAAAAQSRAEAARRDEQVLNLSNERRVADAQVAATIEIARNTPVQLSAARQSEAQARARYDAGLSSIVDVADAENLLAVAEFQDAAARIDVWRALLMQAIAGGDVAPFIDRLRTGQGQ